MVNLAGVVNQMLNAKDGRVFYLLFYTLVLILSVVFTRTSTDSFFRGAGPFLLGWCVIARLASSSSGPYRLDPLNQKLRSTFPAAMLATALCSAGVLGWSLFGRTSFTGTLPDSDNRAHSGTLDTLLGPKHQWALWTGASVFLVSCFAVAIVTAIVTAIVLSTCSFVARLAQNGQESSSSLSSLSSRPLRQGWPDVTESLLARVWSRLGPPDILFRTCVIYAVQELATDLVKIVIARLRFIRGKVDNATLDIETRDESKVSQAVVTVNDKSLH